MNSIDGHRAGMKWKKRSADVREDTAEKKPERTREYKKKSVALDEIQQSE